MSNLTDYQMKLEVIKAIPDDQIVTAITIPVDIYVHEAEKLQRWCQDDRAALTARGMDWGLVDDLPVRCGALMEAESRWKSQRFARKEAEEKWAKEYPQVYKLRNLILREFRFAYQDNESLKRTVKAISDGQGHADMLQDLNDLAVLGKQNPDHLTAINFDMTMLDRAAQLAEEKSALWAEARSDRAQYKESKKIRDQAYTHLKQAVDKIRKFGRFIFWQNNARLLGYRSEYVHKKNYRYRNKLQKNKTPSPDVEANPAADPKSTA